MTESRFHETDDGDPEEGESTAGDDVGLTDPEEILRRIDSIEADTNHTPGQATSVDQEGEPQVVEPRPDRTYECLDCGQDFDSIPYQCECGSTAFRTGSNDEERHEGLVTWFTGSVARMTAPYNPYIPR